MSPGECQKLIDALEQHPVLRFVGAYPLLPDLKSTAKSVTQAVKAFGSNVALATLHLDTFQGKLYFRERFKESVGTIGPCLGM